MATDKISVIVPVYNLEKYISRCVGSILAQTYQNLEIILVDDGSRDGSLNRLRELAREDARIVVVHQENSGVTAARLRGAQEASGAWIGFVDGDDEIEPWMYERLLKNAHDHGADISHCGYLRENADGSFEPHFGTGELWVQDQDRGLRELIEERQVEPGLWNKLYRAELFEGLPERMDFSVRNNEDMLMNFYLFSAAGKSVFEDVCPYRCCHRADSASRAKLSSPMIYDPIRVRQRILEQCSQAHQQTALDAYLRVCLYSYARLTMQDDPQYDGDKKEVRRILAQRRKDFGILSKRNFVLASLACYAPAVFKVLFRAYVKRFLGGVYE